MKALAITIISLATLLCVACDCTYVPSHVDKRGHTSQGSNWCVIRPARAR